MEKIGPKVECEFEKDGVRQATPPRVSNRPADKTYLATRSRPATASPPSIAAACNRTATLPRDASARTAATRALPTPHPRGNRARSPPPSRCIGKSSHARKTLPQTAEYPSSTTLPLARPRASDRSLLPQKSFWSLRGPD